MDAIWHLASSIELGEVRLRSDALVAAIFHLQAGMPSLPFKPLPIPFAAANVDPIIAEAMAAYELEGLRTLKERVQEFVAALFFLAAIGALVTGFAGSARGPKHRASAFDWCTISLAVLAFAYISVSVGYDILSGVTSSVSRAGASVVAVKDSAWFWMIVATKSLAAAFITIMAVKAVRINRRE